MGHSSAQLCIWDRVARLAIAGLSLVGVADALYMLAYHGGLVDSLVCPWFGEGCNIVGRSRHAKHLGTPNAAVGAVGYAAIGALALWLGDRPAKERPLPAFGLAASSGGAFLASLFLSWEQAARVRAWCFWCLLSAAINLAILPLALREGWEAARGGLSLRSQQV